MSQTSGDHRLLDGIDIDERYGIFRLASGAQLPERKRLAYLSQM
jgi:hypothetical protein